MARPGAFNVNVRSRMGSPMQMAFVTGECVRSKPVSRAFSAMTRRKDGTATMAVGRMRVIISSTSIGETGPTRTTAQPSSRKPSAYASPAMKQRSNATATSTVSLAVSPAQVKEIFSFTASRFMSASVSIHSNGLHVVPLVVTISTMRSRGTQRKSRLRADKVVLSTGGTSASGGTAVTP